MRRRPKKSGEGSGIGRKERSKRMRNKRSRLGDKREAEGRRMEAGEE